MEPSIIIAILSIIVILVAIIIGNFWKINIGLISIVFAFLIGYFLVEIPSDKIVAGWPLDLFFVLFGMTLFFGIARINGTLSLLARKAVEATLGKTWLIPIIFFFIAGVIAAVGPGNVATCALVLPIAMTIAVDLHISPLLMVSMIIAGSNAGGLSPIAPTGIIANSLISGVDLNIDNLNIFYKQIVAQLIFAGILYLILKGHRLKNSSSHIVSSKPLNRAQKLTTIVFLFVIITIVFGNWNIGLTTFTGAAILLLLKASEEGPAISSVPWSTILLICGVTMLVKVSEIAGGIHLLSQILTMLMNPYTAAPIMAFMGGALSLFSSASGVVMPTLIPTVPDIVIETGADSTRITLAIILGAHMVTNSPISTLGALALSYAGSAVNKTRFFNNLFLIGIGGLFYVALIVYLKIV